MARDCLQLANDFFKAGDRVFVGQVSYQTPTPFYFHIENSFNLVIVLEAQR